MIDITLCLDYSGCLSVVESSGHSGFAAKGHDIVCSAVSVLLRTVSRTLELEPAIEVTAKIEKEGKLYLELSLLDVSKKAWLQGVSAFTVMGLKDLASEYPSFCRIHLEKDDSVI
ncbi:MAG: ribosomal-processing cysteine protease Prp [Spirochaetaceae bacterium]|nr:ribosomal-processing cysteine protease Prp [Spirochaetaceae bacterium]